MSRQKSKILSFLLHFFCIIGLLCTFLLIARFYLDPARFFAGVNAFIGVDFYQFPTYLAYVKEHLNFPIFLWRSDWFAGIPFIFDYAWLHFYLATPLVAFFDVIQASQIYALATLFLYFLCAYFLFYELSKNRLLSLLISLALMWSSGLYVPLFGGGNTTTSTTLFFAPLSIYFIVKYYHTLNRKFFFLSALSIGLAFLSHPAFTLVLVLPPSLFGLLFYWDEKTPLFSLRKIFDTFILFILSVLIGAPVIYQMYTIGVMAQKGIGPLFAFHTPIKEIMAQFLTSNNYFLYLAFGFLFIGVLLTRSFKFFKITTPFILGIIFISIFEWLYSIGYNPVVESVGPGRTFWVLPLMLGCLIAVFYRSMKDNLNEAKGFKRITSMITVSGSLVILGLFFLQPLKADLLKWKGYVEPTLVYPPEINKVFNQKTPDSEKKAILQSFIPSWMDTTDIQHRFYTIDGNINIWWNIIYDLPLYHGYYSGKQWLGVNWAYWTNMVVSGEQVYHWKAPLQLTKNQAQFLIDWQSIKYIYAQEVEITEGMKSPETNDPLIGSFLTQDENIIETEGEKVGPSARKFWQVKEKTTSKIVRPSNSPTLLVVGDDNNYDSILRILAMNNLNSKYIIPIHGPDYIDGIRERELKNFDIILLYGHKYKSLRSWKILEDYVKNGGKLIINTGGDNKEVDLEDLPAVFPTNDLVKSSINKKWNLDSPVHPITSSLSVSDFSPPVYEDGPWGVSVVPSDEDLRPNAKIILSDSGHPILVSRNLDKGTVVWSGMNLPYHLLTYHNKSETLLFKNILNFLVILKKGDEINFEVQRPQSENIRVTGNDFKGVILGENAYGGWTASVKSSEKTQKLKIYKAGPDFMYVRLPQEFQSSAEVRFHYRGSVWGWFLFILSVSTIFVVLKKVFLLQKSILPKSRKIFPRLGLKSGIKDWWWKDDEV